MKGGRQLIIEVEAGVAPDGKSDFAMCLARAQAWLPPHDSEGITSTERAQIARDIDEALTVLRIPHILDVDGE